MPKTYQDLLELKDELATSVIERIVKSYQLDRKIMDALAEIWFDGYDAGRGE